MSKKYQTILQELYAGTRKPASELTLADVGKWLDHDDPAGPVQLSDVGKITYHNSFGLVLESIPKYKKRKGLGK